MAEVAAKPDRRSELPTGVLTFLFTDIEGSTRLLQELGDAFPVLLETHHGVMRRAISGNGGTEVGTEGDAFFAVFPSPARAIAAAAEAQRALSAATWPAGTTARVRMGLHVGEARLGGDNYAGLDVHRAARIAAAAHGGQVVVSDELRALVERELPNGVGLRDLGRHRLKDLQAPEHLHQLVIDGLDAEFPPLRSLDARPPTLPQPLTSLVGRAREIEEVRALVDAHRLVTLLGPGGTGKSRLAIAVAEAEAPELADGVVFVALEATREASLVPSVIAQSAGVTETRERGALEALAAHLADKRLLLVLDNFEQVLGAAPVVETLLGASPGLRLLVTSRSPLHLYGEQQYQVAPLGLPDLERLPPPDDLGRYEAVRLFVDRVRMVAPRFSLDAGNAQDVAEVAARLDGIPLAIELVAARANLLTPRAMLDRLRQRVGAVSGPAGVPERQRSLDATIGWSHDQLLAPERILFRRLSVFAGGCTLDAAESVCNPEGEVAADLLEPISSLVDNSLLRREASADGEPRFGWLATIREFAAERLRESDEADAVRRRHAQLVLDLVTAAEPALTGKDHLAWLERLTTENENIRAALRWATVPEGETRMGLLIAARIWRFWQLRAHIREGRQWIDGLLARPDAAADGEVLAMALTAAGNLAYWQGQSAAARDHYQRALDLDRERSDARRIADGVRNLGFVEMLDRNPTAARERFREALDRWELIGDRFQTAEARASLGASELMLGNLDAARELMEASLEVTLEMGALPRAADNSMSLSMMALRRGDLPSAAGYARQAIEIVQRLGDPARAPIVLDAASAVGLSAGSRAAGVTLASAAAHLRVALGGSIPSYFSDPAELLAGARDELGEVAYEAAWSEGELLDGDAALARALEALPA